MLKAINEEKGDKYFASEAFKKFPNPKEFTWVCEKCDEEVSIKKEHIRLREDSDKEIWVCSHFSHKPGSSCEMVSESESHYNKKDLLASQLYSDEIPLKIGNTTLLINYNDIKGVEVTRGRRRADILIEFKESNSVFGSGIVIEVMESEEMDSIWNKFTSWFEKGYSFTYFKKSEFSGNRLESGVIEVKYPFAKASGKYSEKIYEEIKSKVNRLEGIKSMTLLSSKYENEYTCNNCKHSSVDKNKNGEIKSSMVCCWKKYNEGEKKRPEKFKPNHTCSDWKYGGDKNLVNKIEKNYFGGD